MPQAGFQCLRSFIILVPPERGHIGQGVLESSVALINFSEDAGKHIKIADDVLLTAEDATGAYGTNVVTCKERSKVFELSKLAAGPRPATVVVDASYADADLIKHALLNVVLNGIQAMNEGGTLSVVARRDDEAATVEVRDQGGGIPPEIRDKIFNLYFTTKHSGSGIGLAMSYRVLQLHNGALDFVTEMGRGTTFRLVLPLAQAQEQQDLEAVTRM